MPARASKSTRAGGDRRGAGKPLAGPQLDAVADLFRVLAEPTRLRILQRLKQGPANVGQLVEDLEIKQANASKQLGVLAAAGIIAREQDGNRVIYSIAMPLVLDLCNLVCHGVAEQARERAAELAMG